MEKKESQRRVILDTYNGKGLWRVSLELEPAHRMWDGENAHGLFICVEDERDDYKRIDIHLTKEEVMRLISDMEELMEIKKVE
jgi:hypothetical protein